MKKLFAVLTVLAMLLSAAAIAETADFLGIWYLVAMQSDGETMNPADFGMSMIMELKEDGSVQAETAMGEEADPQEGTWAQDGESIVVTIDGDPASFVFQDGQLVGTDEAMSMVFGREPAEGEVYTPAEVVAAEEADFEGAWTAVKYGADGLFMDASLVGMDMGAEFKDGGMQLSGFFGSDTAIPMTFADGAYSFATDDESEMFASITAEMLEDGNLKVTMSTGEDEIILIMAPGAAAEEPAA